MPLVQITLLEGRTNQQKAALANAITEAITEYLDVPNAHTTVIFKDIRASDSFQG